MNKKKSEQSYRLPLRRWAVLDDLRRQIENRAKEGRWGEIPDLIIQTILLSVEGEYENIFWVDVVETYNKVLEDNLPTKKFPILETKSKGKSLPWEYEGRGWYFWCNLFASHYGWTQEEIGNLDVDDALGLYEEIEIDEQLRSEWEWGLSEVSYSYDKSTKKSRLIKLPRPDWMKPVLPKVKQPEKTYRMPKSGLPMGNVINLDEEK